MQDNIFKHMFCLTIQWQFGVWKNVPYLQHQFLAFNIHVATFHSLNIIYANELDISADCPNKQFIFQSRCNMHNPGKLAYTYIISLEMNGNLEIL